MNIKVIAFGVLALVIVGCLSAQYFLKNSDNRKSFLIQKYEIRAAKDFTQISGMVKFRDFTNSQDIYPQKVEFNNQPMQNNSPDEFRETSGGCSETNNFPKGQGITNSTLQADKFVFSLVQDGYRKDNVLTVYDENGNPQSFTISFEPIEFIEPTSITLSRSKDNVVKLKGKGNSEEKMLSFIINQNGNSVNENLFRYDKENNSLTVPAKSLSKLKNGMADFTIINGDGRLIETPGQISGNSYSLVYTDIACAKITD